MTRGLKLNNPCNLKISDAYTWQGEVVPTTDFPPVFCSFKNMVDGVRAATIELLNYHRKDKDADGNPITTIRQLITRFAPPDPDGDNNPTEQYITNVSNWVGVEPDATFDFTNADLMESLVEAIARQEQGIEACISYADLTQGVTEALT